jgi:hypothetical protein
MRSAFYAALALTVLALTMVLTGFGPPAARACPTSAGMADRSKPTKPSSFAPHPRPPGNAYGAPVGGKILTRRVKKKPTPPAEAAHSPAI